MTRATAAVKWLVVIWLIGVHVHQPWVLSTDEWRIPALYGIYDVEEFVRSGVAVAKDDDARWQRVVIAERAGERPAPFARTSGQHRGNQRRSAGHRRV